RIGLRAVARRRDRRRERGQTLGCDPVLLEQRGDHRVRARAAIAAVSADLEAVDLALIIRRRLRQRRVRVAERGAGNPRAGPAVFRPRADAGDVVAEAEAVVGTIDLPQHAERPNPDEPGRGPHPAVRTGLRDVDATRIVIAERRELSAEAGARPR